VPYSMRDPLGQFVKPRSMKGKMCPHACCWNKRGPPGQHAGHPALQAAAPGQRRGSGRVQGDSRKGGRPRAQVLHEMDAATR